MVRICIDPGHGGENLGAEWGSYLEKEMTLITAQAMKEELEQYDGIEVFMTREEDKELELDERVEYAKSVNADFLFCLHYNMSVDHDLYGSETWISAFGNNYASGMDFSKIEMKLLTDTGLYDRGIKTRLNSKGTNYYGILRNGDLQDIPAVIIEHCHLDNIEDEPYYDYYDKLVEFGKIDATAVAMYYGLKSESLHKDYTSFSYEPTVAPNECMVPDSTEPVIESIEYEEVINELSIDENDYRAYIPVTIRATDEDCRMLYYSYSIDGGISFTPYYRWTKTGEEYSDSIYVRLAVPYDENLKLVIKATNLYMLETDSDVTEVNAVIKPELPNEEIQYQNVIREEVQSNNVEEKDIYFPFIVTVFISLLAAALIAFVINICYSGKKKRRKKKKRI